MEMGTEAKTVNLDEWTLFGEGGVAKTYIGKDNPEVVLKLNNENFPPEASYGEFIQSSNVCSTGIACPQFYEFVTDGTRFGYTSQRIMGKKSFSRLLADNPSRIKELAEEIAEGKTNGSLIKEAMSTAGRIALQSAAAQEFLRQWI